jgi:hypothetical protein
MFNMMILKREHLDAYCRWLFDLLFELEKRVDVTAYDAFHARFFGRISELLLDVWLECNPLAKEVRAKGRLTYSNILNYDAQTLAGNHIYIDRFIESETDYIQTDYCELIAAYLRKKGLR